MFRLIIVEKTFLFQHMMWISIVESIKKIRVSFKIKEAILVEKEGKIL